jgi:hypothetical protein
MRVIVSGGRNCDDISFVEAELSKLHHRAPIDVVIHGCTGAHAGALEHWARSHGIAIVRYPPNWERFGHRGESLRNIFMLEDSRADLVVAFPGGECTSDLVQRAVNAGLAVLSFPVGCRSDALGADADDDLAACRSGAPETRDRSGRIDQCGAKTYGLERRAAQRRAEGI